MEFKFQALSLKNKLTIIILATSGLMIMVVSAILLANEVVSIKRSVLHNLSTIAKITAINSTAALSFGSPETASELLQALKAEPHIVAGAIYSKDGKLFAKFSRIPNPELPDRLNFKDIPEARETAPGIYLYAQDSNEATKYLQVAAPVKVKDKSIGAVLVQADKAWIYSHIKLFTMIVFLIMAALIAVSYIISSRVQRIVSEPIEKLATTVKEVRKRQDYSLRVETDCGSDELGLLIDGFNNMLEQIQKRDRELEQNQIQLERQVRLRTEALRLSEAHKQKLWLQKKIQQAYSELVSRMNSIDVNELLTTCLFQISEVAGVFWGAVFLLDKDSGRLKIKKDYKAKIPSEWRAGNKSLLSQIEGLGLKRARQALEKGKPFMEKMRNALGEKDTACLVFLAFPLEFQTKRIGVLVLAGPRVPDDYTFTFLNNSTRQLGVALHNAIIFEDLVKKSAELAHSNLELQRASRMKSDFLANMSHELRTPLNAIIGFSEILLDQHLGTLNDVQKEYLGDVLESGRHLLALISDILDLSKIEAGKAELVTENVLIKDILESGLTMIRYKAMKHNIELHLDIDESVPEIIRADQQKFKQIVYNLVSNAVKFTPDMGKIELSARMTNQEWIEKNVPEAFQDERLFENGGTINKFLVVSVRDTGIGIEEKHLHKIFDAFEQVDSSRSKKYKGTGLGLALCKNLVRLHGGLIWVKSSLGRGSVFSFAIPVRGA